MFPLVSSLQGNRCYRQEGFATEGFLPIISCPRYYTGRNNGVIKEEIKEMDQSKHKD